MVYCVLYAVFSSSWLNIRLANCSNTVMVYFWRLDKENTWQRQIIISKIIQNFDPWLPSFPPFSRCALYGREGGKATTSCATINHIVTQYAVSFIQEIQPLSIILKWSIVNFKNLNSISNFNVAALLKFEDKCFIP